MSNANRIRQLFDFQKYEQNEELSAVIAETMARYPQLADSDAPESRLAPQVTRVELTEEELALPAAGVKPWDVRPKKDD